jgi:hypothetical protein
LLASHFCRAGEIIDRKDSVTVIIKLDNGNQPTNSIDSIYLIFDRYDHTAAGVVKRVCYPVNNIVEIAVPKGKYFVDIFCLGNYKNRHFDRVFKAKHKKKNSLLLKLDDFGFYVPGFASIPVEKIDFANLSITRYDSFK